MESTQPSEVGSGREAADQMLWWAAVHEYTELIRRGIGGGDHVEYLEYLIGGGQPGEWQPRPGRWSATPTSHWDTHLAAVAADSYSHPVTALVRNLAGHDRTSRLCEEFAVAQHPRFELWLVRAPSLAVRLCAETYLLAGFVPTPQSARFLLELLDSGSLHGDAVRKAFSMTCTAFS